MEVRAFAVYTAIGALLWVTSITGAGYLFGDIPAIKGNLSVITLAIIVLTVLPSVATLMRAQRRP
jgi:membrane-associated protein